MWPFKRKIKYKNGVIEIREDRDYIILVEDRYFSEIVTEALLNALSGMNIRGSVIHTAKILEHGLIFIEVIRITYPWKQRMEVKNDK